MNNEVMEALRSAQELCAYLWNNTDANDPEAGNVELVAHSDKHAEQLAALGAHPRMTIAAVASLHRGLTRLLEVKYIPHQRHRAPGKIPEAQIQSRPLPT